MKLAMKFSEVRQGRVFVIRLEDGDILHEEIEKFACEKSIRAASLIVVGGADAGSKLIVGPEVDRETPIRPMEHLLERAHEVSGAGTIFPDEEGNPMLHMHIACGRKASTVTGCVRSGIKVWNIMEVILFELVDSNAVRAFDAETGFKLLQP